VARRALTGRGVVAVSCSFVGVGVVRRVAASALLLWRPANNESVC